MSSRSFCSNIMVLICLFGLLPGMMTLATVRGDSLEIISVANSGFYLCINEQALVIDALFDNESPKRPGVLPPPPSDYENPSLETLNAVYEGATPFKPLALALVTHVDVDHFTAPEAAKFLSGNPEARMCCPLQVAEKMRGIGGDLQSRIILMDPGPGIKSTHEIGSMVITGYGMHHSGDRPQTSNVAYLIEWQGMRILHLGDARADAGNFNPLVTPFSDSVDVAFIPYWYFDSPERQKIIRDYIPSKTIVCMHMRKGARLDYKEKMSELDRKFPLSNLYVFTEKGDRIILGR